MKNYFSKLTGYLLRLFVLMSTSAAWAELPKPPDSDMASSSKDWIDVGGSLMNKVLSITCIAVGAAILIGVAAGILKAYHVAHEKGDLGHFFKMLVVGLLAAAVGIGLIYAGYQVVSARAGVL